MKKINTVLFLFVMAVFFTSCSTTLPVVTQTALDRTLSEINSDLSDYGYEMSGASNESKNEVSVSGVSYSRWTGYGSAMKNNYWQYDEYTYVDSLNNNVSFTIKYQRNKDVDGRPYLQSLEMTNCYSNKNYNTMCGKDGIVRGKIENLANNPDASIEVENKEATVAGIVCSALGLSTLITLLILFL